MIRSYAAIDTETTGFDHEEDRLVEIAVARSDGSHTSSLVNPGDRRISFGAMATHHITPDMLSDAPEAHTALFDVGLAPPGEDYAGPPDVLVFHNAEFDRGFLPEYVRDVPYICTWRCALHMFPLAESHSCGSLWYELGLSHPMPPEAGSHPHRALFDALMTRDLVDHMLGLLVDQYMSPITHLMELTHAPVLLTKCRFGKHREEKWEDIPTTYMRWVLTQDFDKDTHHTCQHWLDQRGRL